MLVVGMECWYVGKYVGTRMYVYTHTHLLRTVIANSVVECIVRAKTLHLHVVMRPEKIEATIARYT